MGKNGWMQILIGFMAGVILTAVGLTIRGRQSPSAIQIIPPEPTALPGPTATPAPISVYINGEINNPGVYEIASDSRLEQLLQMAGGWTADAYEESINLALPLVDGAQIFIQSRSAVEAQAPPVRSGVMVSNISSNAAAGNGNGLININTAGQTELETVPGIGPSTAEKIMTYREENGTFLSIEDIMNVSGIGEGKFEQMRDSITINN